MKDLNEQEKQLEKAPKTHRAMLSCDNKIHQRLKSLAVSLGRSIYELTDEAIESYLLEMEERNV